MRFQAHRGVNTEYPENSLAAYRAAKEQGYELIELDPKVTADGKFVLHHDRTVNRTGRYPNGSPIEEKTELSSLTLAQLRELDFGVFKDEKFRGTKIPTFTEMLDFIKEARISIKIDNVFQSFTAEQTDRFFAEIKNANCEELVGFSCKTTDMFERVAREFPYAELHWDGVPDKETKEKMLSSLKNNRFTIWIPYDNDYTAWFSGEHATAQNCEYVKTFADLGIWTLATMEELKGAVEFGADAMETNGELKPYMLKDVK